MTEIIGWKYDQGKEEPTPIKKSEEYNDMVGHSYMREQERIHNLEILKIRLEGLTASCEKICSSIDGEDCLYHHKSKLKETIRHFYELLKIDLKNELFVVV